jgi:hypothetical protein
MPTDKRITDLGAQTGAVLADGDLLEVVDVSDTTVAATGTGKKITAAELGIGLGVGSLQSQAALQAAQTAARAAADLGYFVYAAGGCALTPNATPTKLDMAAGTVFVGTTELNCAAQTAISTTIASLADATNPKWVAVELDTSKVVQFNQGAAAAKPVFPTPTASRVVLGWLYVPANATNVDTLLTTDNGLAKLIDARIVRVNHPARVAFADISNTTATNPTALTTILSGAYSIPADSLNVGDVYDLVASLTLLLHTTSTTQYALQINGTTIATYTTTSLAADTTNTRGIIVKGRLYCTAIGASAAFRFDIQAIITNAVSTAGKAVAESASVVGGAAGFASTSAATLDLKVKNATSDAATVFTLNDFTLTKVPA